jgi:hypothetical protein
MEVETSLAEPISEDDLIYLWRFDEAVASGYSSTAAGRIASETEVELELARKLARLGCPEELALAILL